MNEYQRRRYEMFDDAANKVLDVIEYERGLAEERKEYGYVPHVALYVQAYSYVQSSLAQSSSIYADEAKALVEKLTKPLFQTP